MKAYITAVALVALSMPAYAGGSDRSNAIAGAVAQSASSSQSAAGAIAGGGNAGASSGTSNSNNTTFKYPRQAPGIGAPGLAASSNACLGSVSAGASGAGFGASFGVTYLERNCEARAVSELLHRYGQRQQALRLLINEHPMVRRTYARAKSGQ